MSETAYSGGCFCGAVRYRTSGKPTFQCYCHCESCRRAAGAAPVAWVTFLKETFEVTHGALTLHESSPGVVRGFCSTCGSSLTYEHEKRPGEIDLTLASFDEAEGLAPKFHVWVCDKPSWVEIGDDLPQFDTVPPPEFLDSL